jgi:hypothetical protein
MKQLAPRFIGLIGQAHQWRMPVMQTRTWIFCLSLLAIAAAGCNRTPPASTPPQAQPATASFQDFGNYSVHYNALRTDSLTPEIARSYGIQRSSNRVMLNVTMLLKEDAQTQGRPVDGTVEVSAYNLNGQMKGIDMRRISEGDAIYYIGDVSISGTEILVFDITATPTGAAPMKVKLQREFYSN